MIKYITYKEKQHPVRVSFSALKRVKEETGKDIDNDFSFEMLEPLLFWALKAGYHAEGKIFEIKREDVEYMLDECLQEFTRLIPSFFSNGNTENVDSSDSDKKKAE